MQLYESDESHVDLSRVPWEITGLPGEGGLYVKGHAKWLLDDDDVHVLSPCSTRAPGYDLSLPDASLRLFER